jgi:hypothetical protein
MTCADCCAGTLFVVLTLVTIGVATAGTIAFFAVIEAKKLHHVSKGFQIGLIIVLVVVCLIFIFSLYASCCGQKVARGILGVLFILLALVFIAFAVLVGKYHTNFGNRMEFMWKKPDQYKDAIKSFKDTFNCTCFTVGYPTFDCPWWTPLNRRCNYQITHFVDGAWKVVLSVAVIMAALLIFGAIIAFGYACRKESGRHRAHK